MPQTFVVVAQQPARSHARACPTAADALRWGETMAKTMDATVYVDLPTGQALSLEDFRSAWWSGRFVYPLNADDAPWDTKAYDEDH